MLRYNTMMYILHGATSILYRIHQDGPISEKARDNIWLILESLEDVIGQIREERQNKIQEKKKQDNNLSAYH